MLSYRIIIPLSLLLIFCNKGWGQKLQVSESIDIANEINYQLIARYDSQVLLYRQTQSKVFIQSFSDENLTENWIKTIAFEKNDITTIKIIPNKESFFVLYYFYKRNSTNVRLKEFNTEGEEINDFSVGIIDEPCYIRERQLVLSEDKTHFLIHIFTHNENELEIINFNIEQQKQLWHKKIKFEEANTHADFQHILVNNAGDVYVVYDQDNNKNKLDNHSFNFYKIDSTLQKTRHTIPFHEYMSYDMDIHYDEKNKQLVAAGFYSNQSALANGVFYFKTNVNDSMPTIHLSEFDEIFMRNLTGKKSKKMTGVQNIKICQLVLRNDGGVLLVAEQQFTYQSIGSFNLDDTPKAQTDYLFENILVMSIHPSGEVYWKEVLFKSQSSENDDARHSSFFAFKTNSSVRFLYNNEISWSTSVFEYVVNGKGQVQRNVIMHQERKSGVLPLLSNSIQISASEILTLSVRDKKLKLLKIKY